LTRGAFAGTGYPVGDGASENRINVPMATHALRPRPGAKAKVVDYRKVGALLKHVGEPTRLQVLLILADGEQHVGVLHDMVGRYTLPGFAHHLGLLRHGGLLDRRRQGKRVFYALTDLGRRLVEAARALLE
jgi:DNA-binding transcriptional ArsR family regulator